MDSTPFIEEVRDVVAFIKFAKKIVVSSGKEDTLQNTMDVCLAMLGTLLKKPIKEIADKAREPELSYEKMREYHKALASVEQLKLQLENSVDGLHRASEQFEEVDKWLCDLQEGDAAVVRALNEGTVLIGRAKALHKEMENTCSDLAVDLEVREETYKKNLAATQAVFRNLVLAMETETRKSHTELVAAQEACIASADAMLATMREKRGLLLAENARLEVEVDKLSGAEGTNASGAKASIARADAMLATMREKGEFLTVENARLEQQIWKLENNMRDNELLIHNYEEQRERAAEENEKLREETNRVVAESTKEREELLLMTPAVGEGKDKKSNKKQKNVKS